MNNKLGKFMIEDVTDDGNVYSRWMRNQGYPLDEPDIGLPERADMEHSSVYGDHTEDPSQDDYLIGIFRKTISHDKLLSLAIRECVLKFRKPTVEFIAEQFPKLKAEMITGTSRMKLINEHC